jgi:hypothetical protein
LLFFGFAPKEGEVIMDDLMDSFVREAPVAVMVRAALTRAVADSTLDELFERTAQVQYTKELAFSTLVKLMAKVTFGTYDTVHSAFLNAKDIAVSISAVYQKLQGIEGGVVEALIRETAQSMREILDALPLPGALPIAGLRVRMLDGNFLAGTDHCLECLRGSGAAALPGMALVVRDGQSGLLTDVLPCEDAYTNERSLYNRLLLLVRPDDLWLADRNFCTLDYLRGIADKGGFFLVRHHAGSHLTPVDEETFVGANETGDIYEQKVRNGEFLCRCLVIRLFKPLRDGSTEMRLLTNVPKNKAGAKRLADLYRTRWEIESAFQELTVNLCCEVNTLGYPKAASFAFALALLAYNVLVVVQSAVAAGHGKERDELSTYHLAIEVATTVMGMSIALPEPCWQRFAKMTNLQFAAWLHKTACNLNWRCYRKSKRGPKKPTVIKRTRRGAHRSTARELVNHKKSP